MKGFVTYFFFPLMVVVSYTMWDYTTRIAVEPDWTQRDIRATAAACTDRGFSREKCTCVANEFASRMSQREYFALLDNADRSQRNRDRSVRLVATVMIDCGIFPEALRDEF